MPVTIVATAGSASANSFVTLAEADTYAESRLNASTWDDATADTQNRALVEATRELSVLTWIGWRTDDVQALSWPRQLVRNPDDPYHNYYGTTVIPQRVKDATCELAFQFVKSGTTDVAALDTTLNIRREKIDVLETEYFDPFQRATGLHRFPRVWDLIQPLVTGTGVSVPVVRA